MKYLIDTHVLIWYMEDKEDKKLSRILDIIENPKNKIYISIASLWEITIKLNIGKFKPNLDINDFYTFIYKSPIKILNIKEKHLLEYRNLPLLHREPFDRILIATAIAENITFITHDKKNHEYDVKWEW